MDIREHRFISYFEEKQADELCQTAQIEDFLEDKVLFEEGDISDYLYLVLKGKVYFSKRIDNEKYQIVAHAEPDDFFGEFGVLDGQPRSARALATKGTQLGKIPRDELMEILKEAKGEIILNLFGYIINHLRMTTDQYVKELVHKSKMVLVGEMVNTIIHDFKSPFTGIQLSSSMLRELYPEDEEVQEWCDLIQIQVMRMLNMAEEVLDFTKGTSAINKTKINLVTLLQHFEKINRVYLQANHVNLRMDIDDLVILGDENKLLRVFQNLIGNAVEAFDQKGGNITLTAKAKTYFADIVIVDNGPGIPDEIQQNLFEPFVTFGKRGGTGLGTAIAKSIIDAHKGDITFQSNKTEGTIFYLRLPLAEYIA